MSAPTASTPAQELTRKEINRRLLRFGRPVIRPLGASIIFRILGLGVGIALLAIAAATAVRVVDDPTVALAPTLWLLVGLSFAKGVLRYLEQYTGHSVAFRALAMLRMHVYNALAPQSPAGIYSRQTGDLLSRATKDVDRVEVFFAHSIAPAVSAVVVPLGTVGWLSWYGDPRLALAVVPGLILVGILLPRWGRRRAEAGASQLRRVRGDVSAHTAESMAGIREILAFGAEDRRLAEGDQLGQQLAEADDAIGAVVARRRSAINAVQVATIFLVAVVGHALVLAGDVTWGQVAVSLAVALALFPVVRAVEDFEADLGQAYASARRIWEVTDAAPATTDPADPQPLTGDSTITFHDVTFGYRPGEPVIEDLSFTIPAGSTTAIVGPSGSGKSTIAHLITRVWDPWSGHITIGGSDIGEVALRDLRSHVGVVAQSTYLFNDTVAANLRLVRPDAEQAELVAACRAASLHDDIMAMPDGYDTVVGPRGERLSGGQRQRMAIARVFLQDAPILILDEATSQLDVASQAAISQALAAVSTGRTVIIIAHRPEAIRDADEIMHITPR